MFSPMKTFLFSLIMSVSLIASIHTENIEYQSDGVTLEGFVAYPEKKTNLPAILIVHDWMGISPHTKERAETLAKEGYVAFAADIYGKGIRPKDSDEASKLATHYKSDRKLLRERINAALNKLNSLKQTNPKKVVAMGYCFGGTTALELARSGAPVVGIVSFHGGLNTSTPNDAKNIKGRVLALHGADDPFVPPAEVRAFKDEMKKAGVKLEFIAYPNAVHSFTIPLAGNDNSKGAAYNAKADKESWIAFHKFLKEVF